jgi:hypothetical protein
LVTPAVRATLRGLLPVNPRRQFPTSDGIPFAGSRQKDVGLYGFRKGFLLTQHDTV